VNVSSPYVLQWCSQHHGNECSQPIHRSSRQDSSECITILLVRKATSQGLALISVGLMMVFAGPSSPGHNQAVGSRQWNHLSHFTSHTGEATCRIILYIGHNCQDRPGKGIVSQNAGFSSGIYKLYQYFLYDSYCSLVDHGKSKINLKNLFRNFS
jgi:hypothetical protein